MRFPTLRHALAPTLLLCVASCGEVAPGGPGAGPDATEHDADNSPDGPPPGEIPVNTVTAGAVTEGETLSLTGLLVTSDADTASASLVYTVVSLPADGSLQLNAVPLVVGSTFNQVDIDEGRISYVHDGAENATDSFRWTVSDGATTVPATGSTPFTITVTGVNDAPVIVNNPLTSVAEGATVVLTSATLLTSDAEGATLTYTLVAAPGRGQLQKGTGGAGFVTMAANATFTQQDVTDGNIRYVDSGTDDTPLQGGSNTSTSFSWRVADGAGGLNPSTGSNVSTFTVTAVDDAPVISWRASGCYVANSPRPANPVMSLSDVDNPQSAYSICVVSIGNGSGTTGGTTTQPGSTETVAPVLRNGGSTLGVDSCVSATALTGLTLTNTTNGDGGSVTWKLVRSAVQHGANGTMTFVMTAPPC